MYEYDESAWQPAYKTLIFVMYLSMNSGLRSDAIGITEVVVHHQSGRYRHVKTRWRDLSEDMLRHGASQLGKTLREYTRSLHPALKSGDIASPLELVLKL